MEFDNIETIKRAIEIDAGVSLLPEPTVLREVAAGTLVAVPLATDELVRPLGNIHRRGKQLSATTWRFVELLKREGDRLPAESAAAIAAKNGNSFGSKSGDSRQLAYAASTTAPGNGSTVHSAGHSSAGHGVATPSANGNGAAGNGNAHGRPDRRPVENKVG